MTAAGKRLKTNGGRPAKPRKLGRDEQWCWKNLIEPAQHLGELDTALAWQCCELWAMYRDCQRLAVCDPVNKDIRIAVTNYAHNFRDTLCRLGIDPIGRERLRKKPEDEQRDPLKEFGIVAG